MKSIWERGVEKPSFPALRGEKKTDVLIIGGGMTGILCAYMLRRAGIDCLLVEAGRICGGVTGCTTAKVTIQHGLLYAQLLHRMGTEVAQRYFCAQQEALERYRTLCQKIDCDFSEQPAYVYSLGDRLKIERETDALNRIGCTAEFVSALALPFDVAGAVRVARQAQMHPLKLAYALAKELPIYENSRVVSLSPACAITEQGSIRAEQIIVATHFPFLNRHGSYFLKLYQHRSYVLALESAQEVEGMYVDEAQGGLSFRNAGNCLLLGGGGHRTGKRSDGWQGLVDFADRHYPQAREVCRYATQDCMTLDGMPYVGRYAARTHGLYVATGFNKWGMTSAMVAAALLTDLVQGRENEYANLFSPSRSMLHPQLAVNTVESLLGLLTPTAPRCPHMGCALRYNRQEHTWDCPCHGSRFARDGRLLDNPANGDKRFLL